MSFRVSLTLEAERDLLDICRYVELNDSPEKADALLRCLEEACDELISFPERGHVPPELRRVGVDIYREIHSKPYRIIYEIDRRTVLVHAVLDGRRDLQSLLQRRILRW